MIRFTFTQKRNFSQDTSSCTSTKIYRRDERIEYVKESAIGHTTTIVHSIDHNVGEWRTDRSNRGSWTSVARNGVSLLRHFENSENISMELELVKHIARAHPEMCMFCESLSYQKRHSRCASASTEEQTIPTSSLASRATPSDSQKREGTAKQCRSK